MQTKIESDARTTIHSFVADGDNATSSTSRLEMGRALVSALRSDANWAAPARSTDESVFRLVHDRLYQYGPEPPRIASGIQWPGIESLREWGVLPSPDSDECISLQHLDEFKGTDVQVVARLCDSSSRGPAKRRLPDASLCQRGVKRVLESEPLFPEPVKRPKLITSSIVNLLPQPHFVASRNIKIKNPDTTRLPRFSKRQPLPVPPYTVPSVSELLGSQYRRGAWLIPIRGQVPFDDASMAVITQSPQDVGLVSELIHLTSHKIIWTREILINFWDFLLKLQQAANLGPISLSFHAASPDSIFAADTASDPTEESANNPYHQFRQQYSKTTTGSSLPCDSFTPYVYRAQLEATDYIKVYHNVPYSLSLRSVLDAYQYRPKEADGSGTSKIGDLGKSRVLKGARLAFMDERSKGAFLM